jgi:NADH dehydrogenase
VAAAAGSGADTQDAVGPELYSFNELLLRLRATVGGRARLVHLPATVIAGAGRAVGPLLHDVLITREELGALTSELLISAGPATGSRSFAEWLPAQAGWLGRRYANELRRNWVTP